MLIPEPMKNIVPISLLVFSLTGFSAKGLPRLSSLPSATATIFFDFDGHYVNCTSWNGGAPINCAPSGLTDAQITEIFNRVSEDFRPFNVDITTDSTVFLAAPLDMRVRIIVTPTSSWYPGVGGISYTGSFTWGDDTPGFVFPDRLGPDNTKMVAECCTHEAGHTVGLSHQAIYDSNCNLLAVYNTGTGSGQTGWAPIMGNSYYQNFTGWYNGPTPWGCSQDQDALTVITTENGFTYRPDDHGDDPAVNPTALAISNNTFADSGIISTSTDKDVFRFALVQTSRLMLKAVPFSVGPGNDGADLDVKLKLINAAFQVIGTYDPIDSLDASIDTVLVAGTYYVSVEGSGNAYATSYGSLGSYKIAGGYDPLFITGVQQATLEGTSDNGKVVLDWSVVAPEAVSSLTLETSTNGRDFTPLASPSTSSQSYSYAPAGTGVIDYRLKAVSVTDRAIYSNVIALKVSDARTIFSLAGTQVYNQVVVHALENYEYKIMDMSGRVIEAGKGTTGTNSINVSNIPNGIYLVQISNNNQRLTERILRL